MKQSVETVDVRAPWQGATRKSIAVVAGALLVTLGAQIAVPIPGTHIPVTMQVPAVLIVGGLLGPTLGAASLALYLVMGASGLPVYAAGGVLGVARLFGPTGGYLLAMPLAAALVGRLAGDGKRLAPLAAALVVGTLTIHAGGVAQLAVLGGDMGVAVKAGSLPFLAGDVAKLVFAGLVVHRLALTTKRALR